MPEPSQAEVDYWYSVVGSFSYEETLFAIQQFHAEGLPEAPSPWQVRDRVIDNRRRGLA